MRESQKEEDARARNVRKIANRCVFSMICAAAGSKSRLAKEAGAQVAVQRRNEKLHAVVARSTFQTQNAKKLPLSDHFLKLGCGKIARRCSEKHILKSKCKKTHMLGPFFLSLDVEKLHAAVARSTFQSQNAKKLTV